MTRARPAWPPRRTIRFTVLRATWAAMLSLIRRPARITWG